MMGRKRVPTEAKEAEWLCNWLTLHPTLDAWFHVPNERASRKTRGRLAKQGVRSGVPDYIILHPFTHEGALYSGVAIELKRRKGGRLQESQKQWLDRLNKVSMWAEVCHGFDEARELLRRFYGGLSGSRPRLNPSLSLD